MLEKVNSQKFSTIIILVLLTFVMTSTICEAKQRSRSGRSEIFGIVQFTGSDETSGPDVTFDFESTVLYGLGLGYNVNENFNLNTDFLFGSADVKATDGSTVKMDVDLSAWNVNLDYNIWKEPFTPMVTGGVGFINFSDSDIDETDFSCNVGAGMRWEISNNLILKATYRWTWTALKDAEDILQLDGARVGIGYMF